MPGEAYDSAFSPLAADLPQDQHHGGRRGNRDTTKGTGVEGWENLREHRDKVCTVHRDSRLLPGLTRSSRHGPQMQKLADIMACGDSYFKHSEGFLYAGLL